MIDAEVRYAVRNEYAQTAVDVIARRTRLAFLNAQAAYDALPTVVEIMADELGWSFSERQRQIASAVKFLGSMGLPPALTSASNFPEAIPKSWIEHAERNFWRASKDLAKILAWSVGRDIKTDKVPKDVFVPSRSKFEGGEIAALRSAFNTRMNRGQEGIERLSVPEILGALKIVTAYAGVKQKELDYVLEEAGLTEGEINFDEFIEVRSSLPSIILF